MSSRRRDVLQAALKCFSERGAEATSIEMIRDLSGASVGSIYHHFGGKNELFLAIFERMATAVDRRIEMAMRQAGLQTDTAADARRVFELHVRAYLEAMWENRRLAGVLTSGDTPPGFDVARRNRMQAAFRSWMAVLELDTSLRGQLLGRVLVAIMAESSLLVAGCEEPDEVPPIIDATIEWIDRLIQ